MDFSFKPKDYNSNSNEDLRSIVVVQRHSLFFNVVRRGAAARGRSRIAGSAPTLHQRGCPGLRGQRTTKSPAMVCTGEKSQRGRLVRQKPPLQHHDHQRTAFRSEALCRRAPDIQSKKFHQSSERSDRLECCLFDRQKHPRSCRPANAQCELPTHSDRTCCGSHLGSLGLRKFQSISWCGETFCQNRSGHIDPTGALSTTLSIETAQRDCPARGGRG
jgi:hypothetical protein